MTDRLQDLLRQKTLLQEHAAWLDREIAAEVAKSSAARAAATPDGAAPPDARSADAEAEAILGRYRNSTQSIRHDVARGCAIYFVAALALLAASVVAIYFFYHRR